MTEDQAKYESALAKRLVTLTGKIASLDADEYRDDLDAINTLASASLEWGGVSEDSSRNAHYAAYSAWLLTNHKSLYDLGTAFSCMFPAGASQD